jgi:hypothetical protein
MEDREVMEVLQQIFLALQVAHETLDFTHYDLHTGNIMVKKYEKPVTIMFKTQLSPQPVYITSKYHARIIDFGFAHIKKVRGQRSLSIGESYAPAGVSSQMSNPVCDVMRLCAAVFSDTRSDMLRQVMAQIIMKYVRIDMRDIEAFDKIGSPIYYRSNDSYASAYDLVTLLMDKLPMSYETASLLSCRGDNCVSAQQVRSLLYSSPVIMDKIPEIITDLQQYSPRVASFIIHCHDVIARGVRLNTIDFDMNVNDALTIAETLLRSNQSRNTLIAAVIAMTVRRLMPRYYSDESAVARRADAILQITRRT